MTVTPAGILSTPDAKLRDLLAASATFQTWVGAENAEAAKAHIHLTAVMEPTRPFALIALADGGPWNYGAVSGGGRQHFLPSGSLILHLEAEVAANYQGDESLADAEFEFRNNVGAVLLEMGNLAGSSDYLTVVSFDLIDGPARSHPDTAVGEGDFYQITFMVSYGYGGG